MSCSSILKSIRTSRPARTCWHNDFRAWLVSQGIAPIEDGSPAAFKAVLETDLVRWAKVVKESGAQVD